MKSIPTPLAVHRKAAGVGQAAVADAVGIDQTHFSRIERGQQVPSPQLAKKIAEFFGNAITRDQILFPEEYEAMVTSKKPVRSARLPEADSTQGGQTL